MVLGFVLAALSTFLFAPAVSHGGQATSPSGSIQRNDSDQVFREFTFHAGASPAVKFAELDPKATFKFVGEHVWGATMPRHVPRPIELDLTQAVRAELSVEYWGGHIGTSGQQFQVNSNGWVDLPQPVGTPAAPQRFYRTLLGNNAVPIPLAHLRQGTNQIQFAAGSQIAYSFGFGFYWIYDFTMRVFYHNARPHPTGEILSPKPGAAFGDTLDLEARASSPNGPITRVEFIGEYDDFDWDGNGVWREWQFTTHHGVFQHHLGTATNAPWRVRFDARWLPDQLQPVRVRARITDATGLVWLTPPVENLVQKRERRSVRMCKPVHVPENFCSRDSKVSPTCMLVVDADLAKVKAARLVLSTWSANVNDDSVHELRLNGRRLASRFGQFHNYSFNALDVPLSLLKAGTHEITLFSTFKGHAIEVNWPGPALLLELGVQPGGRATEPIRARFWLVEPSMTADVVKARTETLFRSGINTTIIRGQRHHFLHNDLPYIEDYIAVVKLIVAACHARSIKVIEPDTIR
jgi:hypothetical protein